jgi:hypothetical protein
MVYVSILLRRLERGQNLGLIIVLGGKDCSEDSDGAGCEGQMQLMQEARWLPALKTPFCSAPYYLT